MSGKMVRAFPLFTGGLTGPVFSAAGESEGVVNGGGGAAPNHHP
jgi:hypothetical protein